MGLGGGRRRGRNRPGADIRERSVRLVRSSSPGLRTGNAEGAREASTTKSGRPRPATTTRSTGVSAVSRRRRVCEAPYPWLLRGHPGRFVRGTDVTSLAEDGNTPTASFNDICAAVTDLVATELDKQATLHPKDTDAVPILLAYGERSTYRRYARNGSSNNLETPEHGLPLTSQPSSVSFGRTRGESSHLWLRATNSHRARGYDKTVSRSCAVRRTQMRAKACAKSTSPRALATTMPAFRSLLR